MAYGATVIEIMIASPGDVAAERDAVEDIIQQWNYTNARHRDIVLIPRRWESSSAPVSGAPGQKIINKQVLENCDILVAIFWAKIGSPTGDSESGTIDEIKTHIAAGKPVMLYFSTANIPREHDPQQLVKLNQFKEEAKSSHLYSEFASHEDLKKLFREHIDIILHTDEYVRREVERSLEVFFSKSVNLTFSSSDETGAEIALSETAKRILIEACMDPYGTIYHRPFVGGLIVQTNNMSFDAHNEPRKEAELKQAINQLEGEDLIEPESYERNSFKVTMKGYEYYDNKLKPA